MRPTLLWAGTQLVPSPELVIAGSGEASFGVRWQVTPLLYSFHVHAGLSPWRMLVAEPLLRHSGSLELFVTPEYVARRALLDTHWIGRAGLRSYFPLASKGESLSISLGASAILARERVGMAAEAGVFSLGGLIGVVVGHSPTPNLRATTVTFSVRYF